MGHWIRIIQGEIEKCMKAPMMSIPGAAANDTATDASDLSVENLQSLQEKKDFYRNLSTELTPSRIRYLITSEVGWTDY